MNDKDKNNLNFLLYASKDTIEEWFHAMDPADHMYALELLHRASAELTHQSVLLDFDIVNEFESDDYSLANSVLAKFRLK